MDNYQRRRLNIYFKNFQNIYQQFHENYPLIVISGQSGMGKTTLSRMIIDDLKTQLFIPDEQIKIIDTFMFLEDCQIELKNIMHLISHGILYFESYEHLTHKDVQWFLENKDDVMVIINTQNQLDKQDHYIDLHLSSMNHDELFQMFQELLTCNHQSIEEQALQFIQKYFWICYYQKDKTVNGHDVLRLFELMMTSCLIYHHRSLSLDDMPDHIIREVNAFLDKENHRIDLIQDTLEKANTMVRNYPINNYIQDFLFKYQVENQMKKRNMHVKGDSILIIVGNPATGKTVLAQMMTQIYYAYDFVNSEQMVVSERMFNKSLLEKAYRLKRVFVLDNIKEVCQQEDLIQIYDYHQKGVKIIITMDLKMLDKFKNADASFLKKTRVIYLSDFNVEELYQIFEQICHQNQITVSIEAKAAIRTLLTIEYKQGKAQQGNFYFVRHLYECINLKRYLRQSEPIDEIILEDVLNMIDDQRSDLNV